MRIHFSRDYDHVTPLVTTSYRAGTEETVAKDVGRAAIRAGAGKEVRPPSQPKTDLTKPDG